MTLIRILTFVLCSATLFTAPLDDNSSISGSIELPIPQSVHPKNEIKLKKNYGLLPLSFERNEGQTDSHVKFIARGIGYTLFITSSEAVLVLSGSGNSSVLSHGLTSEKNKSSVVRLKFNNANLKPQIAGLKKLPWKNNYFIGNDRSRWRTGVTQYSQVCVKNVYPGIDIIYHGNQKKLEYDVVVAPGANPKMVEISYFGAREAELIKGDLLLRTGKDKVVFKAPVVYQTINNEKHIVKSGYVLAANHQLGFEVKDYDRSKPLVIDPILDYSTYLGAANGGNGLAIAADTSGNAYITGNGSSTFPTTAGAYMTLPPSTTVTYVAKLNPSLSGNASLAYSTYFGGSGGENGLGIAVDASGNVYITGNTGSVNFPTTAGAYTTSLPGYGSAFISEFNPSLSGTASLVYSTYLGGGSDSGQAIALDSSGNVYVSGYTYSAVFPTTSGAYQTTLKGATNAFFSKLNPGGHGAADLIYSTYLGGNSNSGCVGIAVDGSGNAYVIGNTTSTNFPTTAGAYRSTLPNSNQSIFVSKINPAGGGTSDLVYSTYLGGTNTDQGHFIAVDGGGNAYVTGFAKSSDFPTTSGAFQTVMPNSNYCGFVCKFNPSLSGTASLVYSTFLGGSGYDNAQGIALDSTAKVYITGYTGSNDFPTVSWAYQPVTPKANAIHSFVTKLDLTLGGSAALLYSTYLGGNLEEYGNAIATDSAANVYVTGFSVSSNYPTTAGAYQPIFGGTSQDIVVTKFDVSAFYTPTPCGYPGNTCTFTATVTNTSTRTATNTRTATPTKTSTNTSTDTPTNTPTNTSTNTSTDTATSSATNTVTATSTYTSTNSVTSTSTVTATNTSTSTPTITVTNTVTNSVTSTDTSTVTSTVTNTATITDTNTTTNTATVTSTNTFTNTFTNTATVTSTFTPSNTFTMTDTSTITNTPTVTPTYTFTSTPSLTVTNSPTYTQTQTPSITNTPTVTITATPTAVRMIIFNPPYPNPVSGSSLNMDVVCPPNTTINWDIFTLAFRKIDGGSQIASGDTTITWNLLDKNGVQVSNGLYYLRFNARSLGVPVTKIYKVLIAR